jgi:hypothetical protein
MKRETSAWAVGWTLFAALLMIMASCWWLIAGIAAIVNDKFYVLTPDYLFKFDPTTWGWIHIGLAVVSLFAAFGLFTAAMWARVVGVVLAILGALAAFAWLPWYPVWAIVLIAISAAIIWSLTIHGQDITEQL